MFTTSSYSGTDGTKQPMNAWIICQSQVGIKDYIKIVGHAAAVLYFKLLNGKSNILMIKI